MTTRVHDERSGRQERFDLIEPEQPLLATRNQTRGRRVQHVGRAFDLRRQRRDVRFARRPFGPSQRSARRFCPQPPHGNSRNDELVGGPGGGWKLVGVDLDQRALGLVQAADQEQAPKLEVPRVPGVREIAVRFEGRPRCVERLRSPAEVARDESDLRLGDDAPRAGHGFFGTEGARSVAQQSLRPNEIAELRHRDASKRERRSVARAVRPASMRREDRRLRARAQRR